MIPSTRSKEENTNISLQLEVDEGAESVDDDSSNDSYHDSASEEEDYIKQEPEFMDCTPQNGDSTYQMGDEVFPLLTSEWVDPGGDHLSQAIPMVKQEPTDSGEYENSMTQSVVTIQTKTVSGATSRPFMLDTNGGVVKKEQTDNGEYENSVTKCVGTTQTKTVSYHSHLASSGATSYPVMSDPNVGVVKQEPTDIGLPSVMSSNIVTSSDVPALQPGPEPQSVFSIIPGVSVAQTSCSAVQNPAVIGAPTLLPVTPAIAQTINLGTSGNVVPPQVLNLIRRGNSLILGNAAASPSTVTPNIQNPLFTFALPVALDLQSDSNLPPTIPMAVNVSNVDQGGSVTLQPILVPVSVVELSSRGQQVSMSSEYPSVSDPVTKTVKHETPSTNTPTGSHNRGADDRQTNEGCKQMDEKMFYQNRKLEAHMRTHTGEEPYNKCDVCGKECSQAENLQRHMRIHIEKPYACDVCGKAFNHSGHVKTHMRIHTGDKPFKCEVCGKAFNEQGALQRHIRRHTGDKPYKCEVCGKTFNEQGTLQRHILIHTGDKPFKCEVCGKAFFETGYLNKHMRIHSKDKHYKCDVCGELFNHTGHLQRHIRTHTGVKPYKCDVCGKAFIHTGHLQKHMRIHTDNKTYKCDVCGKAFIRDGLLHAHTRTHIGDKLYNCDGCGKAFNHIGYLKRHVRIHTGDKPYKCGVCGKTFNQAINLLKHVKKHTGDKP